MTLDEAKQLLDIVEGEVSSLNVDGAKVSIRLSKNPLDSEAPHANVAVDGATTQMLARIQDAGFYVYGSDPLEGHDPDGYSVYARIESDDVFEETSNTGLVVDNAGVVVEVSYTLVVDPKLPLEESLAQAEADLAVLHDAVAALDVPAGAPGLLSYGELPEEFRTDYLAGSPDEDVFFHDDELNIADGVEVSCSYSVTIDEGEYLSSHIWLNLEPAE